MGHWRLNFGVRPSLIEGCDRDAKVTGSNPVIPVLVFLCLLSATVRTLIGRSTHWICSWSDGWVVKYRLKSLPSSNVNRASFQRFAEVRKLVFRPQSPLLWSICLQNPSPLGIKASPLGELLGSNSVFVVRKFYCDLHFWRKLALRIDENRKNRSVIQKNGLIWKILRVLCRIILVKFVF